MGAAAPARKAAPAPARRKTAGGRRGNASHSPLRQKPKRSPKPAGGARQAVRSKPAPTRKPSGRAARATSARPQRQGHFVPYAVGRTAGAVRHLPDGWLVSRLTRGRAWIAVLSVLLTGIVGLNVVSLSLSASQGKLAQASTVLEQENSALRARLAEKLSSTRVRHQAAALGMTEPVATDINYRDASPGAVKATVRRLSY